MLAPGCLAENLEMNEKLPPERYCHVDPNVYEVVYADALLPNKFGDGLWMSNWRFGNTCDNCTRINILPCWPETFGSCLLWLFVFFQVSLLLCLVRTQLVNSHRFTWHPMFLQLFDFLGITCLWSTSGLAPIDLLWILSYRTFKVDPYLCCFLKASKICGPWMPRWRHGNKSKTPVYIYIYVYTYAGHARLARLHA